MKDNVRKFGGLVMRGVEKVAEAASSPTFRALQISAAAVGLALLGIDEAMAQNAKGLGAVADNINKSIQGVTEAIGAISYAGGVGMAALGAVKLKAHRDNPQQTPLGTPITLLGVAALMLFLPSVLETGGETIWGDGGTSAGSAGENMRNIR